MNKTRTLVASRTSLVAEGAHFLLGLPGETTPALTERPS